MARLRLTEGTIFEVPTNKGDVVGVVSRMGRGNAMIGYFFPPGILELEPGYAALNPTDAIAVLRFGPLGFKMDGWPLVGIIPDWQRDKWNMTTFKTQQTGIPGYLLNEYDDNDISKIVRTERVPADPVDIPDDGLRGHRLIPAHLERLLP
ncbi:hypothetical protein [Arthrobacter sp. MMS24-S77]